MHANYTVYQKAIYIQPLIELYFLERRPVERRKQAQLNLTQ